MDNTKPRHMSYKLLHKVTGGFSKDRILGSGGFGMVYKGVDEDGQEIAVKLLHSINIDDKEFRKEFENISRLKHSNIVQLLGFCSEEEEEHVEYEGKLILAERRRRALCFEYMHNGSLEDYISDAPQGLSWQHRYRIIKGICEGLKYLHTGLASPICHLDLKPANILLDKKMTPKIADFGLSRIIGEENTKRTATQTGTLKYMPPEFIKYSLTSKEYDIYSLGVIIIMIMAGPRVYSLIDDMKPAEFVELVHKQWRERLQEIPGYMSFEADCEQVKKCIEIASDCIEDNKQRRPSVELIVHLLSQTEKQKNELTSGTEEVVTLKRKSTERNSNPVHLLPNMTLSFLEEITDNFSPGQQLGKGAFGSTYKGLLPDGRAIVVKKLYENLIIKDKNMFENGIRSIMGLGHENIVKLVGYCYESEKKVVRHSGRHIVVDIWSCLICHEYLALGSLDKYIFSKSNREVDWDTRFKIIMGICEGLRFLHNELAIIHMNIRSENILLNYNWVPKIGDFGLARLLGEKQTRMNTMKFVGAVGYMAPEYLYRDEISFKSDIYSLGLLIVEITTGEKKKSNIYDRSAVKFAEKVRQVWTEDEHAAPKYLFLDAHGIQQAKACIEMGLQCVDVERRNRPSIDEIINKLHEIKEIKRISTELLDIYPRQLSFAFMPSKSISRSLQLTNKSDDCVAVRLQSKGSKRYKMPLFGIVPPHSTYTLVVTTREQKKALPNNNESLTLESIIIHEGDLSMNLADADSAILEYENIFKMVKRTDANNVHELTLPVACVPPRDATSNQSADQQPLLSEVEILSNDFARVLSVDIHPSKPWIMTSHYGGNVVIWNYKKQGTTNIFEITKEPVYSTKFIEREGWLVAGDHSGTIYVYNYYVTEQAVTSIEDAHDGPITSLDVHPTEHFVLSSSEDDNHLIKLWDWENGWKCSRTFMGHSDRVTQVNFNPTYTNSFASASLDHTIRIWTISSSESIMTLCDHADGLLCVHNYISNKREYLISGFWDGSAQVWDVEEERCVQTLKGHGSRVSCVYSHPELPVVITGSHDGTVRVWNSTTYRLENIIGVNLGVVHALGYIERIRRLVIGCYQGIAIVELNSA